MSLALGGPVVIVHEFRASLNGATRTPSLVAKASRASVEPLIALHEFGALFGGSLRWRAPEIATDEMPGEAWGVWGNRTIARFRAVLRERGATICRVTGEGPAQAVWTMSRERRYDSSRE
ncbi:MAG TPA: hypothetical protein VFE05_02420 [Longimicrobiaceae bacterium]|jgi:hypothetical protein|nr:hypothetical protein [Longimicrobiaceae bacterium]